MAASLQLLSVIWFLRRPGARIVFLTAAVGNVAIVAIQIWLDSIHLGIWLVSRATGLPFGSGMGVRGVVHVAGTLAALQGIGIVLVAVGLLRGSGRWPIRLGRLTRSSGLAVAFVVLASAAVAGGVVVSTHPGPRLPAGRVDGGRGGPPLPGPAKEGVKPGPGGGARRPAAEVTPRPRTQVAQAVASSSTEMSAVDTPTPVPTSRPTATPAVTPRPTSRPTPTPVPAVTPAPSLSLIKTVDSTVAAAGSTIGFTTTLANSAVPRTGTALGVTFTDRLTGSPGVNWSIDSASAPLGVTCAIVGGASTQTLSCGSGPGSTGSFSLSSGQSIAVHVTSATTRDSCQVFADTAGVNATNHPPLTASASVDVFCPCALGYPFIGDNPRTSVTFSESDVLAASAPIVAGPGDTIRIWYKDERAMTLGVRRVVVKTTTGTTTTDYPVTAPAMNPGHATNPSVGATALDGAQAGTDVSACSGFPDLCDRPMFPSLFITDITTASANRAGDWQFGGTPIPPSDVFGTWKGAVKTVDETKTPPVVTVMADPDPKTKNNWNLGPGSDTPPGGFASLKNEGYGAEARWNVSDLGLLSGHTYRIQVMIHDGDQNKVGGDAGEACFLVVIPG